MKRDVKTLLAANLRRLRGEMTQGDLAKKSGQRQATISAIENAEGNPTLDTLQAIAKALKTSTGILLAPSLPEGKEGG